MRGKVDKKGVMGRGHNQYIYHTFSRSHRGGASTLRFCITIVIGVDGVIGDSGHVHIHLDRMVNSVQAGGEGQGPNQGPRCM